MKPSEIVRKAIQTAHCMDFDVYCKVFDIGNNQVEYAKSKWRKQQNNFGKWYCGLDLAYAKVFMDYVLREK